MKCKGYCIYVEIGSSTDILWVKVKQIKEVKSCGARYHVMEFVRKCRCIPDDGLSIPSSRTANFKEELRILGKAYDMVDFKNIGVEEYVMLKMKEAYGGDAVVYLEDLT